MGVGEGNGLSHNEKEINVFSIESKDISTEFAEENFGSGGNKSPALNWTGVPPSTKSFAISLVDINAWGPGLAFDHWFVIDIPASVSSLPKDAGNISGENLPAGAVHTLNGAAAYDKSPDTSRHRAYAGVGPKPGTTNQYEITIFALDVSSLGLPTSATPDQVKAAIAKAQISSAKMSVTATG